MRDHANLGLAVLAVVVTGVVAAVFETFPFPFYVGLFVVGPLSLLWFLIPAFAMPWLTSRLPVNRRRLPAVAAVTLLALGASVSYLHFVTPYGGYSIAGELAEWSVWVAGALFALLAAAGYLRESNAVTRIYHLVLVIWFFAIAFPYMGEFCC